MKKYILKIILFFLIIDNLNAENNINEIEIFKNLRCLICQGQSIADSNSDFAQTIKSVVKDKIKSGATEKEVYDFMISKYGEWIVYKPMFKLNNFLLWLLPYFILILGGFFIVVLLKKGKKTS